MIRNLISTVLVWLAVFGLLWFIATIDNLNWIPISGLILALICFPLAKHVGGAEADT